MVYIHSLGIIVSYSTYVYTRNKGNCDQVVQLMIDSYTTLFAILLFVFMVYNDSATWYSWM